MSFNGLHIYISNSALIVSLFLDHQQDLFDMGGTHYFVYSSPVFSSEYNVVPLQCILWVLKLNRTLNKVVFGSFLKKRMNCISCSFIKKNYKEKSNLLPFFF